MAMFDMPSTEVMSHPVVPAPATASHAPAGSVSLADLPIGAFATIEAVLPGDDENDRHLVLRLVEIGFVPGERVRVVAVGRPGHEPIAIRLAAADSGRRNMNGATFALRRHEAGFIRVLPDLRAAKADRP